MGVEKKLFPAISGMVMLLASWSSLALAQSPASISIAGVVNGASFAKGSIAPGTIVSIFGSALARNTISATSLPLPALLDGTSVTVNGQALPLFFVSPGQINAQVPFQVQVGPALLTVNANGSTATVPITIAAASPAVFTTTSDGKGAAIAVHADFKLVQKISGQNAQIGETIVLFCTGLGSVDNFSGVGVPAPSSPLAYTTQKTTVLMNGRPAQVTFSGLAPQFVGLYQINFVIPPGVGGDVATTVNVGGFSSNPVTINVRGTYTLGGNYLGSIQYRTGETFVLGLNAISASTATTSAGLYEVRNGSSTADSGTFKIENTPDFFVIFGKSSVAGGEQPFVGALDTLDAGQSFVGVLYNADSLDKVTDFNNYYASFNISLSPPPPPPTPAILPGISSGCASVEGALLFSGTTFLGRVTSNSFAADSIGNRYGAYGSEFSTTSIFDTFGPYGSEFSATSAFNLFAADPPVITDGVAAAYLTINQFKTPRIDPRALFPCIGR